VSLVRTKDVGMFTDKPEKLFDAFSRAKNSLVVFFNAKLWNDHFKQQLEGFNLDKSVAVPLEQFALDIYNETVKRLQ
jgi:hypothetical protein